ncbi:TlpA family protein disulfide reductase [Cohnella nanjingensis]|uniref:TlpA family protein disulfide reductase n=1 Tax=Cohnella nanjingensis TaxID=1387779 RepID=A0A7X0VHV8_9BACL|nr:TlpA disulfide reductase family protein [Cohnella nanjingensis]MBB6674321.1 TlpA family protein disulfide reductase [Cohnella nanjingensis]
MKRNIVILGIVVAAIIAIIVWNNQSRAPSKEAKTGNQASAEASAAPIVGSPAPSYKLASLDGNTTYEVGGKRDKVLIVNFWASWCWPCEQEAPDLVKLYEKYKNSVDLYAVNATKYDTVRGAKDFVKEQALPFPIMMDKDGKVGDDYKVFSYPISFIVDREGVVQHRIDGPQPLEEWAKMLDPLVGKAS